MSAEYKVTKGIYTRKYQAKNIWEVGGAYVEKQRIQRNFARCLNPPCKIFGRYFFMVRNGQILHHEENLLAKFSQGGEMVFPWLDAVVFWRPYLPHSSSKSYSVWRVGFLTSWALKWYIACRKWTSGSASKVRKKTVAVFFTLFSSSPLLVLVFPLEIQACNHPKSLLNDSCQAGSFNQKYL